MGHIDLDAPKFYRRPDMSELKRTLLSQDPRPIVMIELTNSTIHAWHKVGINGVTKISAVDVEGEMSWVPWFEVWKGDDLYSRVNAKHVSEVVYEEGPPTPAPGTPEHDDLPW